jgi:hypothetical protein
MLQQSTLKMEAVRSSEISESNTLLGVKEQNIVTVLIGLGTAFGYLITLQKSKTVLHINYGAQTIGLRVTYGPQLVLWGSSNECDPLPIVKLETDDVHNNKYLISLLEVHTFNLCAICYATRGAGQFSR